MDANEQDRELRSWDPFLPAWWRALDARRLARGRVPIWSPHGDRGVADYAGFLGALRNGRSEQDRATARRQWPAIRAAHRMFQKNAMPSWLIEAYVLARLSDAEIAARCDVATEVVQAYVSLFFDVRASLDATYWLINIVIRAEPMHGFRTVREFWQWCALARGPLVLEHLVKLLREALQPGERPQLIAYFRPAVPLRVQAFVAALITPPYVETHGTFRDLHEELQAAETMTNLEHRQMEMDRLRAKTVRLALAVLEDKPLPRKRRSKGSQATARQDGDAAETGKVNQNPAAGIQGLLDALKRPF